MASIFVTITIAGCAAARPGEAAWGPWESLGGVVSSLPDCRARGPTIDCWALSTDAGPPTVSTLAWLRGDGDTWAEWVDLGGSLRAAPECVSRGNGIDCFAATVAAQGGGLGHVAYDGRDWGEWGQLGGSVKQKPACVAGPGQEITCLALATDDRGWWHYHFDGQAWRPATKLPFPGTVRSTLRPSCVDTARGLACFAIETTLPTVRRLWTILLDKGGSWGAWEPRATGIAEPPHCLASGAKLDCFSRSTANRLVSASFNGDDWGPWLEVGGATVQSQPYCNRLGSGFDCYWTSPEGELRRRQREHGVWLAEEDLDGSVRARPECLANPGGQRIDCFVQGTDDTLHHRAFD